MTVEKAREVKGLISARDRMVKELGVLVDKGEPNPRVWYDIAYGLEKSLTTGAVGTIILGDRGITHIELTQFLISKTQQRIKAIDDELSNY